LGLAEVENREVLELLLQTKPLRSLGYAIAHFDSPDARGIDVALLYQPQHFQLDFAKKYRLRLQSEHKQRFRTTRDQLVVSGFLEGVPLTVLVNHWPSRRGGAKRSNPLRMAAARLQAKLIDSLQRLDANPQIISMGDFNDNPNNASIAYLTKPQKLNKHSEREPLFNATEKLFNKGVGSLAHNDQWFLFDQILLSNSFQSREKLFHLGTKVFNPPFLRTPEGRYKGYPYRTHQKGELLLGYSDHFPVYVVLGLQVR
jgi:endonuclease/exonuclease/phosphatase family metal-dependent hydrolase